MTRKFEKVTDASEVIDENVLIRKYKIKIQLLIGQFKALVKRNPNIG